MRGWWACLVLCAGCPGDDAAGGTGGGTDTTMATSSSTAPGSSSATSSSSTSGSTVEPQTGSSGDPPDTTDAGSSSDGGTSTGGAIDGVPCGGGGDILWAWGFAGEEGEHLDLVGDKGEQRIETMYDQSGRGNDYTNMMGGGQPAYQLGYSDPDSGYQTDLAAIALNAFDGGPEVFEQFMFQDSSLDAEGGFYLAFAGMNTRNGGQREMWGSDEVDVVRLDQERDRVNIVIDGGAVQLTDDDAIDKGPLLLEIWRDDAGALTVYANGQDVTLAGAANTNTFALSGIGHDQTGSSGWDDVAFEYIVCEALPTDEQRTFVRSYLNNKWGLF